MLRLRFLLIFPSFLPCGTLLAQQATQGELIRLTTGLVLVDARVVNDKTGRPIDGLRDGRNRVSRSASFRVNGHLIHQPAAISGQETPQIGVLRVEVPLVTVGIRVTDRKGREVPDCTREPE